MYYQVSSLYAKDLLIDTKTNVSTHQWIDTFIRVLWSVQVVYIYIYIYIYIETF